MLIDFGGKQSESEIKKSEIKNIDQWLIIIRITVT